MRVSRFTPDPSRQAEFLACLWQGDVPSSLRLSKWLYLPGEPRRMLLLWEGDDDAAAYVERAFGTFGVLETESVTDATPGLAAAFARDLDAFGAWMSEGGATADAVAQGLEIRRLGKDAPSPAEAAARARAWTSREST
jgi:hypothetical protein